MQSTIALSRIPKWTNLYPQLHEHNYVDTKHQFIREHVSHRTIELEYCSTTEMLADILTKGLIQEAFCKLCDRSGVIDHIVN